MTAERSTTLPESWYFLGVGGAGMNALALHLLGKGKKVFGYDRSRSESCLNLEKAGAKIEYEPRENEELDGSWGIVFSPAVPQTHPVFQQADRLGLPVFKRAELLGLLSKGKRVIGVAGTHGKTTICAMAAHFMRSCGLSVTAFVGGYSLNLNGHYAAGDSDWWLVEADEFDRSFLQLEPELAVVSAIDADHLDVYGTHEEMVISFQLFVEQIQDGGLLVLPEQIAGSFKPKKEIELKKLSLDIKGDMRLNLRETSAAGQLFNFSSANRSLDALLLRVPGVHNLMNMGLALSVGIEALVRSGLEVNLASVREAVSGYNGVKRRWEVLADGADRTVILDYAHHPKEIDAVLQTARETFPDREVVAVFQPHLYSRTRDLATEFAQSLSAADRIYLTHIYAAREEPIEGVTCEIIYRSLGQHKPKSILNLNQVIGTLDREISQPSVVLLLGAGDIDQLALHYKNHQL